MIDPIDASAAVFNVILTAGFAVYCWKLLSFFGRQTQVGKAWIHMFIAAVILFAVSAFAFAQAFELVIMPVWWRNVSAAVFRRTYSSPWL